MVVNTAWRNEPLSQNYKKRGGRWKEGVLNILKNVKPFIKWRYKDDCNEEEHFKALRTTVLRLLRKNIALKINKKIWRVLQNQETLQNQLFTDSGRDAT